MNTLKIFLIAVSTAVILSGCSGHKQTEYSSERTAADQCTAAIQSASVGKNGKTELKAITKLNSLYLRVGITTALDQKIDHLSYVESEFLDNGNPGSAWRQCMQEKGFTIVLKS